MKKFIAAMVLAPLFLAVPILMLAHPHPEPPPHPPMPDPHTPRAVPTYNRLFVWNPSAGAASYDVQVNTGAKTNVTTTNCVVKIIDGSNSLYVVAIGGGMTSTVATLRYALTNTKALSIWTEYASNMNGPWKLIPTPTNVIGSNNLYVKVRNANTNVITEGPLP